MTPFVSTIPPFFYQICLGGGGVGTCEALGDTPLHPPTFYEILQTTRYVYLDTQSQMNEYLEVALTGG